MIEKKRAGERWEGAGICIVAGRLILQTLGSMAGDQRKWVAIIKNFLQEFSLSSVFFPAITHRSRLSF